MSDETELNRHQVRDMPTGAGGRGTRLKVAGLRRRAGVEVWQGAGPG